MSNPEYDYLFKVGAHALVYLRVVIIVITVLVTG